MPPISSMTRLSIWLGLMLVSACGTTRGLDPATLPLIPVREELRRDCQMLATPAPEHLPPLAADPETRRLQLIERAFWMDFDLAHNGLEARQCARYLEVLGLIDDYNARVAALAR